MKKKKDQAIPPSPGKEALDAMSEIRNGHNGREGSRLGQFERQADPQPASPGKSEKKAPARRSAWNWEGYRDPVDPGARIELNDALEIVMKYEMEQEYDGWIEDRERAESLKDDREGPER